MADMINYAYFWFDDTNKTLIYKYKHYLSHWKINKSADNTQSYIYCKTYHGEII